MIPVTWLPVLGPEEPDYSGNMTTSLTGDGTLLYYTLEITNFVSDRLRQKIDEYNQKKGLSDNRDLFADNDFEAEEERPKKKAKFKPIEISDDGLELIELVSLDCTNAEGPWHADAEIKIDKNGFTVRDGKKTKTLWDTTISTDRKPLRLKVRNIAGDESILTL